MSKKRPNDKISKEIMQRNLLIYDFMLIRKFKNQLKGVPDWKYLHFSHKNIFFLTIDTKSKKILLKL
jgi:hypothetical protein